MEDKNLVIKKLKISDKEEIKQVIEMLYYWWGEEDGFSEEIFKEIIYHKVYRKEMN